MSQPGSKVIPSVTPGSILDDGEGDAAVGLGAAVGAGAAEGLGDGCGAPVQPVMTAKASMAAIVRA